MRSRKVALGLALMAGCLWLLFGRTVVSVAGPLPTLLVVTSVEPNHGSTLGGTKVLVTGTGFLSVTEVLFGSSPGRDLRVINDSTLEIVSPPHAEGRTHVQVAAPRGKSEVTIRDTFTFDPPPSVEKLTPAHGLVNRGTDVTISGHGLSSVTKVMFGRFEAQVRSGGTANRLVVTTPSGPPVGWVEVTAYSTIGTTAPNSAARFFFSSGVPAVIEVSPGTGTSLGGSQVTIKGDHFIGATRVFFGSEAVRPRIIDRDTLLVRSPKHSAGSVPIRVSSPAGTSAPNDEAVYVFRGTPETRKSPSRDASSLSPIESSAASPGGPDPSTQTPDSTNSALAILVVFVAGFMAGGLSLRVAQRLAQGRKHLPPAPSSTHGSNEKSAIAYLETSASSHSPASPSPLASASESSPSRSLNDDTPTTELAHGAPSSPTPTAAGVPASRKAGVVILKLVDQALPAVVWAAPPGTKNLTGASGISLTVLDPVGLVFVEGIGAVYAECRSGSPVPPGQSLSLTLSI